MLDWGLIWGWGEGSSLLRKKKEGRKSSENRFFFFQRIPSKIPAGLKTLFVPCHAEDAGEKVSFFLLAYLQLPGLFPPCARDFTDQRDQIWIIF